MHKVVVEKPYEFVPPYSGTLWPRLLQWTVRHRLKRVFGIVSVECKGIDRLDRSRQAGHGILLAPNHCRPADPFVVGGLARQAGVLPHVMASAHLFAESRPRAWLLDAPARSACIVKGLIVRQSVRLCQSLKRHADLWSSFPKASLPVQTPGLAT